MKFLNKPTLSALLKTCKSMKKKWQIFLPALATGPALPGADVFRYFCETAGVTLVSASPLNAAHIVYTLNNEFIKYNLYSINNTTFCLGASPVVIICCFWCVEKTRPKKAVLKAQLSTRERGVLSCHATPTRVLRNSRGAWVPTEDSPSSACWCLCWRGCPPVRSSF